MQHPSSIVFLKRRARNALTGAMLGFDAFGIGMDLSAGTFTATAMRPIPPLGEGHCLEGRVVRVGDVLVTAAPIQAGP